MTSERPYLIRTLRQWIIDNHCSPHILVDTTQRGVEIPVEHLNRQIVLNISPVAVRKLRIGNDAMTFTALFDGCVKFLVLPMSAILEIYAKETGHGMMFADAPTASSKSGRPVLTVVK